MKMRLLVVPILFLLLMGMITVPQADASTPPSVHFNSSPITSWYNETPYEYPASISAPYNWTLKTNASLHMSGGNTVNDTAAQTVFGILSTGSYWVNISITYHNATNVTTLLIYQNFTLTILNEPYIYSTPETFFYQDSTYNYTYEINQGNITAYSSGFTLNKTSRTLSEYLTGTSYSFFLTVSDKNGTYTQDWGVSTSDISRTSFSAIIGSGTVQITAPLFGIGVNNTTVFLNGSAIFTAVGLSHPYSLDIVNDTYIVLSTDSNHSQPATIYFNNLVPGTFYHLYMVYDSNSISIIKSMAALTVQSSGTIAFTYNPSTMPLDPVFELLSSNVAPPPPPVKIPPKPFDYTKFIVISAGLLVVVALLYYYEKNRKGGSGGYGGRRI
jgi:hypothetical protein